MIYCGMCGDTGLQNGVKCPQPGCRKANNLPPFDKYPCGHPVIEKGCCEFCGPGKAAEPAGSPLGTENNLAETLAREKDGSPSPQQVEAAREWLLSQPSGTGETIDRYDQLWLAYDGIPELLLRFAGERVGELEAQLAQWKTWGIIEVAVRNPQVAEYCDHWEKRTEQAEREREELRNALTQAREEQVGDFSLEVRKLILASRVVEKELTEAYGEELEELSSALAPWKGLTLTGQEGTK